MATYLNLVSKFDSKGLKDAEKAFGGLGKVVKKSGGILAAALGGAVVFNAAKDAVMAASNLSAEFEGVNQTFGASAKAVQDFAAQASTLVGISEGEALKAAKNFGGFATAAGLSGEAAANFSIDMVKAAGDLASFADVPVEEALAAIRSGLTGSAEPLQKFQIFTDEATLKNYALEQGLGDTYKTMTQGEKTLLRQNAILDQMGVKQGDFVKYGDTFGNSLKTVDAQFKDLQATIGAAFLPALEAVLMQVRELIPVMESQLKTAVESIDWVALGESVGSFVSFIVDNLDDILAFGKFFLDYAPIILGTVAAFTALTTALEVAKVAQLLFNIAANANPYVLAAVAIVAALGLIASGISKITAAQEEQRIATDTSTGELGRFNDIKLNGIKGQIDGVNNSALVLNNTLTGSNFLVNGLIPASPTNNSRVMPLNPKPGEVFTWYTIDLKTNQAVWYTQTWTGTEWTKAKKMTYAPPGSSKPSPSDTETTAERFKRVQAVIKKAQEAIAEAEKNYATTVYEINKSSNERIFQLNSEAAEKQKDLIEESKARITDAFRSASQLSLGELFKADKTRELETQVRKLSERLTLSVTKETEKVAYSSVTEIINGLRERLTASKNLLSNASKLAGLGFKQTFIEQVLETGTETGNALAGAILEASPETQSELKTLFGELEDVSETGAQSLADSIYDKFQLATRAMAAEKENINALLELALEEQDAILLQNLANAALAFQQQVSGIKAQFKSDIDELDGSFAGLKGTIDAVIARLEKLLVLGGADAKAALLNPDSGSAIAGASVSEANIKDIKDGSGIFIDELSDIAGTVAYLQARIEAGNKYIKNVGAGSALGMDAQGRVTSFASQLAELQGKAATGTAAGTTININVKTDSTQSQAMVGKTIGKIVTKYVTTGGQVLVSGN
jgi:hypothetical protein